MHNPNRSKAQPAHPVVTRIPTRKVTWGEPMSKSRPSDLLRTCETNQAADMKQVHVKSLGKQLSGLSVLDSRTDMANVSIEPTPVSAEPEIIDPEVPDRLSSGSSKLRGGFSPSPQQPLSPRSQRGGRKFTVADRHRLPHTIEQRREFFQHSGGTKQSPHSAASSSSSPPSKRAVDYHTFIILRDIHGSIRIDQHSDGTVEADATYIHPDDEISAVDSGHVHSSLGMVVAGSPRRERVQVSVPTSPQRRRGHQRPIPPPRPVDKSELVRREHLQRGTTVSQLLDALMRENPCPLVDVIPCGYCELNVSRLRGISVDGTLYHRTCAVCCVCQEGDNIGTASSRLVCPLPGLFVHHSGSCSVCPQCQQRVTPGSTFVLQGQRLLHRDCVPKCHTCQEAVTDSEVLYITPSDGTDGKVYHVRCLICSVCHQPLETVSDEHQGDCTVSLQNTKVSSTMERVGNASSVTTNLTATLLKEPIHFHPHHPGEVVHARCARTCHGCKQPVFSSADCWEIPNVGVFHDECFVCENCSIVLGEDHNILDNVMAVCQACFKSLKPERVH